MSTTTVFGTYLGFDEELDFHEVLIDSAYVLFPPGSLPMNIKNDETLKFVITKMGNLPIPPKEDEEDYEVGGFRPNGALPSLD